MCISVCCSWVEESGCCCLSDSDSTKSVTEIANNQFALRVYAVRVGKFLWKYCMKLKSLHLTENEKVEIMFLQAFAKRVATQKIWEMPNSRNSDLLYFAQQCADFISFILDQIDTKMECRHRETLYDYLVFFRILAVHVGVRDWLDTKCQRRWITFRINLNGNFYSVWWIRQLSAFLSSLTNQHPFVDSMNECVPHAALLHCIQLNPISHSLWWQSCAARACQTYAPNKRLEQKMRKSILLCNEKLHSIKVSCALYESVCSFHC